MVPIVVLGRRGRLLWAFWNAHLRFLDKRGVRERSGAFLSPVAAKRHPQADVSLSTRSLAAPSAQTGLRKAPLPFEFPGLSANRIRTLCKVVLFGFGSLSATGVSPLRFGLRSFPAPASKGAMRRQSTPASQWARRRKLHFAGCGFMEKEASQELPLRLATREVGDLVVGLSMGESGVFGADGVSFPPGGAERRH